MTLKPLDPPSVWGRTVFENSKVPYVPIYISTSIRNGVNALATLLHELVHTSVPYKEPDHGKAFRSIAHGLGFRSPYSLIWKFSPELKSKLIAIRNKLGPYPPS